MDDPDVDHDLLSFMRSLLTTEPSAPAPPKTNVLSSAHFITDNSIDVALSRDAILAAATQIYHSMTTLNYSTSTWHTNPLHPTPLTPETVAFIFTMDLLNFCFWSIRPSDTRFAVEYKGEQYTGYWSLVAALNRALEEGIPITSPHFWADREVCTEEVLAHVFRSATAEKMPLFFPRVECLREAGDVLCERYDGSIVALVESAGGSAEALVVKLADEFSCFNDAQFFEGRKVNFYKRAQILVADLWACFGGESWGTFHDIDELTMFADYRVPVTLHAMGCLQYAPKLEMHIREKKPIESGTDWEIQLRGASIWCVEMIRREIVKQHPECNINAVLMDFFLYDTAKQMEKDGVEILPHHRTLSIWY